MQELGDGSWVLPAPTVYRLGQTEAHVMRLRRIWSRGIAAEGRLANFYRLVKAQFGNLRSLS